MELWERIRRWLSPPPRRVVKSWIVDNAEAEMETEPSTLWGYVDAFKVFWLRTRTCIFRVCAALLAVVDIILGAVLFSNVWYMNLILYAYLVPSFLILIHYLRLTKNGG